MEVAFSGDTPRLSYWLTWEFLLCLLPMFISTIVSSILIWKYEGSDNSERATSLYDGESWMPCLKGLSPFWLMGFRMISFCLILVASIADVVTHGTNLFYYYTQMHLLLPFYNYFSNLQLLFVFGWTLMLTTIYFLFGLVVSASGCFRKDKKKMYNAHSIIDTEQGIGIYMPLNHAGKQKPVNLQEECYFSQTVAIWGYIFQILFQITAGAVMLTDGVYWLVIFPFLNISDYEMSFLTVVHSLNIVLVLGDTSMNSLVKFLHH
uniref:Uncharacterized protein n=1 Tax=Lactuca sativa TaxID=4236 RepID=A0A9R1UWF6_LACSA|nr:hypothetical protein LSAT_V11C800435820 [Lactuca sativa]